MRENKFLTHSIQCLTNCCIVGIIAISGCSLGFTQENIELKGVHYTTLLPLITNLEPADKKYVRDNLINNLKKHKIIQYKTHTGFYDIFKSRQKNLKNFLYDKNVIKTVSDRLLVGSLIRLEIRKFLLGYEVSLDILSKSGKTFYHRKKLLYQKSIKLLSNLVNFWVEGYTQEIPFDATIVEVQASQVLMDFSGNNSELFPNRQFVIVRSVKRKVDYNKLNEEVREKKKVLKEIAYGVITDIKSGFFTGNILKINDNEKINTSDMVIFKIFDKNIANKNKDYKYRLHDLGNYREYGKVALYGSLLKIEGDGSSANFTGGSVMADIFLPSSLLLMLEFSKKVGQSSGDTPSESNVSGSSLDENSYKVLLGYSTMPASFQYISYADIYGGWSVDQNYLSGLGIVGVGDVSFEGLVVGARLEHPIYKNLSALTGFEYNLNHIYNEKVTSLGRAKSTSGYILQVGMRYRFKNSGLCIESLYRRKTNTADFVNSNIKLNISSSHFMFGVSKFF